LRGGARPNICKDDYSDDSNSSIGINVNSDSSDSNDSNDNDSSGTISHEQSWKLGFICIGTPSSSLKKVWVGPNRNDDDDEDEDDDDDDGNDDDTFTQI